MTNPSSVLRAALDAPSSKITDLQLEAAAIRFTADRIRQSGELGTEKMACDVERMAAYIEDLVFDLTFPDSASG